tara:strand:+ start:1500 stop:1682 length:183 start_codon:yes stop_codon:yes gene_type:complete
MKHSDRIDMIDNILMSAITKDIVNGNLLTEADDDTVEMVLNGIWEAMDTFIQKGVIIGLA